MNKTLRQLLLIVLNILFIQYNTKKIGVACKSKYNHKRDSQVNLLMITDDGENWYYLAVKSMSALFRGITSNNNRDYYGLNCFHSYRTNNILKNHEILLITVMKKCLKKTIKY